MDNLLETKANVIDQLNALGADEQVILSIDSARSESEINNIIANWQRSDEYNNVSSQYSDTDLDLDAVIPRGYQNDDELSKIRKAYEGMPRENIRPSIAIYNNRYGTNFSESQVDSILSQPSEYTRDKVDDFVNQYKNERRIQDSIQNVNDYQNSFVGKSIRPLAQVVDGASAFVPYPYGLFASAIGPSMRAYDDYRNGLGFDPTRFGTDIMYNVGGQAIGGKLLNMGSNLARNIPGLQRFAPTITRASMAKKADNAGFGNAVISMQKKMEQLIASKSGKTIAEQNAINQELLRIGEWAKNVGVKETEPIYRRALEESKNFVKAGDDTFVRPFTNTERILSAVDDGVTKYGVKKLPEVYQSFFSEHEDKPLERAIANTRKAEVPLLKYLIKLDSLARLGYRNDDYEYVSRLLGIDSLSPNDRLRYANEALKQDSLIGNWRQEYKK